MTNHEVEEEALDALAHTRLERVVQRRAERLRAERALSGFCHCNGFFRGSDHCQCCGCEEYEATCEHVCDGVACVMQHDETGRPA